MRMARKVKQIRYYGDNNAQNSEGVRFNSLTGGDAFSKYMPVLQLGVQALPGTRFFLNGDNKNPIIIGGTGIYELDLNGEAEINSLQFAAASVNAIRNNNNAYLIVDMIYDNGGQ